MYQKMRLKEKPWAGPRHIHLRKNREKLECLMSEFFKKGIRQEIKN